jgi:SAM-dependent methyltransferase
MLNAIISRIRGRDLIGIVQLAVLNARHACTALTPAARARRAADQAFDKKWGTDTSRPISVHDLDIGRTRMAQCNRYEASSEAMLLEPLAALGIDPGEYDFIDYGAGKGRVLMLALQAGFRSVTGIELSARLCATAQSNLDKFSCDWAAARSVKVIGADATMYLPAGDCILAYFYNPFDALIMNVVRQRLERAMRTATSRVVVIYANAEHAAVFRDANGWAEGASSRGVGTFWAEAARFRSAAIAA